jgi:hypothetical protein
LAKHLNQILPFIDGGYYTTRKTSLIGPRSWTARIIGGLGGFGTQVVRGILRITS